MEVLEIFHSIDGEGTRAGELATFVRFAGCNLHCKYCDTAYSINPQPCYRLNKTIKEIVREVKFKNVTLTGGEPLLQEDVNALALVLAARGHSVNIETNGTQMPFDVPEFPNGEIFFTADYKCGASGHESEMKPEVFQALTSKDVIKCVVGSVQDLENALATLQKWVPNLGSQNAPFVYFSPVFGRIEPAEIVEFMKQNNLVGRYRVQSQLHKFIWDPNAREV